jgi:hypothetical protein
MLHKVMRRPFLSSGGLCRPAELSAFRLLVPLCILFLTGSLRAVTPVDENAAPASPFQHIPERNIFGLKPPPPPPEEKPVETQPGTPPAKVILTGILNVFGPPRALLEVAETEPGKQPNTKKPILRQGEREGAIEVLSIDIVKSIVRIKNGALETNLTFEVAKQTGSAVPPPLVPSLNPPVSASAAAAVSMSPSDARGSGKGRGIVLAGAEPSHSSPLPTLPRNGWR